MKKLALAIFAAMSALVLLYFRRGATLSDPQVWNEDGYYIVPQFLADGWATIAEPVQGYLISISRIISNTALTFAPSDYPFISTLLAWFFAAAVAGYIAVAPTRLKGRVWLALACFLIPADPETFGTPLYTFWWAGLLLILLPLWEYKPSHFTLRSVTLLLCGLSSPLIVIITPLMAFRAYFLRLRVDYWLFAISSILASIQLGLIFWTGGNAASPDFSWSTLQITIEKFFGLFVIDKEYQITEAAWVFGAAMLSLTAFSAWIIRDRWVSIGLLYLLAGTIALSVARVPVEIIHPVTAGPRYFFYPYIVLSWILIQGASQPQAPIIGRISIITVLFAGLLNALNSGWSRTHDDMQWDRHVESCVHFESYAMPIQYAGDIGNVWRREYSRESCQQMANSSGIDASTLYPYTVRDQLEVNHVKNDIKLLSKDIAGSNYARSAPTGYTPIGSFVTGDSNMGSLTLSMQKDDRLLFTSGPGGKEQWYYVDGGNQKFQGRLPVCIDWCTLDFSSELLPNEFTVKLSDEGTSLGEWFAIGLPENGN